MKNRLTFLLLAYCNTLRMLITENMVQRLYSSVHGLDLHDRCLLQILKQSGKQNIQQCMHTDYSRTAEFFVTTDHFDHKITKSTLHNSLRILVNFCCCCSSITAFDVPGSIFVHAIQV